MKFHVRDFKQIRQRHHSPSIHFGLDSLPAGVCCRKRRLLETIIGTDHRVAWDYTKVICLEGKCSKRKWKEAGLIAHENNAIANRDNGRTLSEVYKMLVKNTIRILKYFEFV